MSLTAILPGAENLRGGGQEAEDRLQRLRRAQAQRHQGQHRLEGRQVLLPNQVNSQGSFGVCFIDDISRPNVSILRSLNLNIQPGEKVSNSLSSLPATKTYKHICSMWILRAWNLKHTNVSKVALVGQSGCGKSTVIQLIQVSSSLSQIVILYSSSQTSEVLWLGRGLIGHRGQWYPLTKRSLCKVIHSTLGWLDSLRLFVMTLHCFPYCTTHHSDHQE